VPENHLNFVYKLDGEISEIDVFKLAPVLLSLGQLIQDSNELLFPHGKQIGVNVKPFRSGSFIVDLTVFSHTNLQQILSFFDSDKIKEIKYLLEWLGLISGGVLGAVKVMKFLAGKPKSVEQISEDEIRYTAGDDRSITVNSKVHQLLSSTKITNNIFNVYTTPLDELPAVNDVRTYLEGQPATEEKVGRSDVPALREFVNPAPIPSLAGETVTETLHRHVYLNPKRGAFDGDPKDWSFRKGDQILTATIKDKDFLKKCTEGAYRLNHSDLLTVDLLERQRVMGTQTMKPTYEIVKVTEYIPGAQQTEMDV
jgi:hypothetical protein